MKDRKEHTPNNDDGGISMSAMNSISDKMMSEVELWEYFAITLCVAAPETREERANSSCFRIAVLLELKDRLRTFFNEQRKQSLAYESEEKDFAELTKP